MRQGMPTVDMTFLEDIAQRSSLDVTLEDELLGSCHEELRPA